MSKLIIITTFLLCFFQLFLCQAYSAQNSLLKKLTTITKQHPDINFSIAISSLSDQQLIVGINEKDGLNPASVVKILTAAAALKELRPEYRFNTEILTDGLQRNSILNGNLYIRAGGDPSIVTEKMYLLADELSRYGFTKIRGDIIVDTSFFSSASNKHINIFKENRAYTALISSLVFNFNTTTLYIKPDEKIGKPLKVFIDPPNDYIEIKNQSITSKSSNNLSIKKISSKSYRETYLISGRLALSSNEKRFYKKIDNPVYYFSNVLKYFLKQRNISITGKVKLSRIPSNVRMLAQIQSRPLSFILKDLFTYSNNMIAENILNTMGRIKGEDSNTQKSGIKCVYNLIKRTSNLPINKVKLSSGSGLSRTSKVPAQVFNDVMLNILKDFSIAPEFLNSLCVAGKTGTLKSRFNKTLSERIRAKTGRLNGVAALAGVYSGQKDQYVFTVIVNSNKTTYLVGMVDKIMKTIGDYL